MKILGIESSCDDSSAAVVEDGKTILSNVCASQDTFHEAFGGVVPEIAARKHLETLLPVVDKALEEAHCSLEALDAIAVTSHPGLIGSLLIGTNTALALAMASGLPLYKANHLSAHLYSLHFENQLSYPLLGLIVSGGHTLLVRAKSPIQIDILGTTLDDACGECFDKIAKFFDLGYPGGPPIDRLSQGGNENAVDYPVALLKGKANKYHFSYSGLKTAVIYHTKKFQTIANPSLEDKLASFQKAAFLPLIKKTVMASKEYQIDRVGICGGVAANSFFRKALSKISNIRFFAPPLPLCTDNAAMVAGLGYHLANDPHIQPEPLSLKPSSQSVRIGSRELI